MHRRDICWRSLGAAASLGLLVALPAQAQPPSAIAGATPAAGEAARSSRSGSDQEPGHDYSRFSVGPRRVPEPRGPSLRRARRLGLGTRRAAGRLLRDPPKTKWRRAVRGDVPEQLRWPVDEGDYGRGFGYVRKRRPDLRHDGVDIVAEEKAVIRAVADGIVAYSDNGIRGFGNCLIIVHANGWVSLYAHNYRNTVQAGWRVERGERIGFVGHTGIARGSHLHFELRIDGEAVDPVPRFATVKGRGARLRERRERDRDGAKGEGEVASAVGTVADARKLMKRPAPDELREATKARVFRNLLWPVKGGDMGRPFDRGRHRGVDIEARPGRAVRAAADGLVIYAGDGLHGVGKAVVMLHRNGWVTLYGSNRKLHVEAGDRVKRGEWIAKVGATGASGDPHLHFELHDGGTLRDPAPLLVQVPDGVHVADR